MENPTEDRKKINSVISTFSFLEMEHERQQCLQLLEEVEKNRRESAKVGTFYRTFAE